MSPAFDHRSIMSYTSIMTGAAQELLAAWSCHDIGASIDVAAAMMGVTLNIISRAMFSSDSEHILVIMKRGAGRYQARMRPNMMDYLGLPAWLAGIGRIGVVRRTLGEFDTEIDRLIQMRSSRAENGPKDLLARLIAARERANRRRYDRKGGA